MNQIIKIGIGVIIINNNQVLLGHRTNIAKDTGGIYEPDSWTLPGGKQEYDETTIEAGIREVKEETNLTIKDLKLFYVSDDISTDRHFVTIDFITETYEGELKVMEPSKKCLTEYLKIKGIKLND